MDCHDTTQARIIINTNLAYQKPFDMLMHSLFASGFVNFEDIIVVRAGYPKPGRPQKIKYDFGANSNVTITEIRWGTPQYDYHSYLALRHFPNILRARAYFYMLDTTVVSPVFSQVYRRLVRRVNPCTNLMLTTKNAASNIAFLSHNCMLSVTRNFSLNALKTRMTKHDAILIEKNEHPLLQAPSEFCTKSFMENRRKVGDNTIYDSKMWRSLYYYPSFGLYKPIRHSVSR